MSGSGNTIFLLHLMSCGTGALLHYYIENNGSLCNPKRPSCTLATPSITYSAEHDTYVELPGNLKLVPGQEYILGYIHTLKIFGYLGCISETEIHPGTEVHHDISSDPGQCFSVCGGRYFGISNTTCYCFKLTVRDLHTQCEYSCTSPNNTVCGGRSNDTNYISVYGHAVDEIADHNDTRKSCLAITSNFKQVFWEYCGKPMKGLCQIALNNATFSTFSSGTWKEYVNSCFQYDAYPLIGIKVPNSTIVQHMWTGIIRSWVIEHSKDATPAAIDYNTVGYIKSNEPGSGPYRLQFAHVGNYKTWKCICFQAYTDFQTTSGQISAFSNNKKSSVDEPSTGSAMIAVYVISPVVLTAVVVGLICIIRRKRKRNDDAYVDTMIRFKNTNTTPGVTNAAYDENCIPPGLETVQDHNYWVLEKATDYAKTDPDDGNNDYDTTTTSNTRISNDTDGNVYNTLEASPDDTYDHTIDIINKIKSNNNNDESVYNTLEASSDDTYDHTRDTLDKIKNIDDTYNHAVKECDKENEYSIANTKNDKQDNAQTFDDTYNHI